MDHISVCSSFTVGDNIWLKGSESITHNVLVPAYFRLFEFKCCHLSVLIPVQ